MREGRGARRRQGLDAPVQRRRRGQPGAALGQRRLRGRRHRPAAHHLGQDEGRAERARDDQSRRDAAEAQHQRPEREDARGLPRGRGPQDRHALGEGVHPGAGAADGGGEEVGAGPVRQARRHDRVDEAPLRGRGPARGRPGGEEPLRDPPDFVAGAPERQGPQRHHVL